VGERHNRPRPIPRGELGGGRIWVPCPGAVGKSRTLVVFAVLTLCALGRSAMPPFELARVALFWPCYVLRLVLPW